MRIIAKEGEFILPSDFQIATKKTNVFLSKAGEQTQPLTLPAVPENLKLIGMSQRIDSFYKPLSNVSVIVEDGLNSLPANLGIHFVDKSGISATLYFGTAEFYSVVDERMLNSIPWPMVSAPAGGDLDDAVNYIIDYIKANKGGDEFRVCPVATTEKTTFRITKNQWTNPQVLDVESIFILNWHEQYQTALDLYSGQDILSTFQGEYYQQIISNNNVINVGLGYGITPFLKLSYVLKHVFQAYGYDFNDRSIEDEFQNDYVDMIILNNVADAIYGGQLRYAQLLPDMKIKDFIAEVEKWFCGKFIISNSNKLVWFEFFSDTKRHQPVDLTPYLCENPFLGAAEFVKKIILVNEDVNNSESENVEEIKFKYSKNVQVDAEFWYQSPGNGIEQTGSNGYMNIKFDMLQVSGIVHKNSAEIVNGETKKEGADSLKELLLARCDNAIVGAIPAAAGYIRSREVYQNVRGQLGYMYSDYIRFFEHSNIPFNAKLSIPKNLLPVLQLHRPFLIQNQIVLVESIDTVSGEEEQVCVFRTFRSFKDRA